MVVSAYLAGLCWLTMALAVSLRYTSQSVSGTAWSTEKGYLEDRKRAYQSGRDQTNQEESIPIRK